MRRKAIPTTTESVKTADNGRQSLAAAAYTAIYRRIVSLVYEPGQRLEETTLMEQLGIGRTPIREALLCLAGDMLVASSPGKGYTVQPITLQNTKAAFDALVILELGVAQLAVRQDPSPFIELLQADNAAVANAVEEMDILLLVETNREFHSHYAACSRNPYVIQALQKVRCETDRLAYMSYGNEVDPERSLKDHYASVVQQHDQIIALLRSRDEAGLRGVIEEHIQIFKDRVIRYLAS